ncbi:uncharacterized protein LOC131676455 [Topomyia yanbarensis]|uniref:uncharacterized protein LOC131676454 n=1 Tax=Topomyia yanbarensis TaxID=2498891 RepID=UPI00273CA24C|nr:uncharacterized protein LOC131676454 [Topomyia yanbarensis]XP_058811504.1 uncharacterized protein LOC131676455 [Topomyia yanbarensis]
MNPPQGPPASLKVKHHQQTFCSNYIHSTCQLQRECFRSLKKGITIKSNGVRCSRDSCSVRLNRQKKYSCGTERTNYKTILLWKGSHGKKYAIPTVTRVLIRSKLKCTSRNTTSVHTRPVDLIRVDSGPHQIVPDCTGKIRILKVSVPASSDLRTKSDTLLTSLANTKRKTPSKRRLLFRHLKCPTTSIGTQIPAHQKFHQGVGRTGTIRRQISWWKESGHRSCAPGRR